MFSHISAVWHPHIGHGGAGVGMGCAGESFESATLLRRWRGSGRAADSRRFFFVHSSCFNRDEVQLVVPGGGIGMQQVAAAICFAFDCWNCHPDLVVHVDLVSLIRLRDD